MSAAAEVLAELQARGVSARADGEQLRLRPADALTPELIARARQLKPELLRLLACERCGRLDQNLAMDEVLGFPAALLSALPLSTMLELELDSGTLCRVATHPGCRPPFERGLEWWLGLSGDGGATVAMVLTELGAVLRGVVVGGV